MEVAAQENIPCCTEGGLTEVYVGGVHFYQNAATFENRAVGQVVLFQFHALFFDSIAVSCSKQRSAENENVRLTSRFGTFWKTNSIIGQFFSEPCGWIF